jgi:mannosylglucosylglycerate synthase
VSVVAGAWATVLERLGWEVVTVAGAGPVDRLLPGLAWPDPGPPPSQDEVEAALDDVDLVVVENLCSLPLHPAAGRVVAAVLAGRPAVLHHHDLPWQRDQARPVEAWPPTDAAWRHVTINDLSRRQLAARGIDAVTIRNAFDTAAPPGDRETSRRALGVDGDQLLVLHPVRALPRKNVPAALALAERLGATYWLTGAAEEGHADELRRLLDGARCPVLRGTAALRPHHVMADAYAAADAVALPSTWEGFGNPLVESALARRPLAGADYPAAREVAALGFRWFPVDDHRPLAGFLRRPDPALLEHNAGVASRHFSLDRLAEDLGALLTGLGFPEGG